jgi:hypothetical protein
MRTAEFKVVEDARRAVRGQFRHFHTVMENSKVGPIGLIDAGKPEKKPARVKYAKKK